MEGPGVMPGPSFCVSCYNIGPSRMGDKMSQITHHVLNINSTPAQLQQLGPTIEVTLELADAPLTQPPERIEKLKAIIDTGSAVSCITGRVADKLGAPSGKLNQGTVHGKIENAATFRCRLFYPCGVDAITDFSVLAHLSEPHDILIGCNLLAKSALSIDFVTGKWCIVFTV